VDSQSDPRAEAEARLRAEQQNEKPPSNRPEFSIVYRAEDGLEQNGFELECYNDNDMDRNLRGIMTAKEQEERNLLREEEATATEKALRGKTCVVQVQMPDAVTLGHKRLKVEVSDECLRVECVMRTGPPPYSPLTVWWPRHFCSALATAEWDAAGGRLVVSLPTDPPETFDAETAFKMELLDAVFD